MNTIKIIFFLATFFVACTDSNQSTTNQQNATPQAQAIATQATVMETKPTPKKAMQQQQDFSIDYIMGKFVPDKSADFVELSTKHASDKGMYLRKDTYEAFQKMYDAALQADIKLVIRSATRPFNHQKRIWEAKWTGGRLVEGKNLSKTIPFGKTRALKILEYSSMPGTSRHHWGTDFDINAFENSYFEKGEGKKIYDWMVKNGPTYGFCQPYTPKGEARPDGYNEEKWHWSYLPVSKSLTYQAKEKLKDQMIQGFKGAETATEIEVVRKYVLGINQACL